MKPNEDQFDDFMVAEVVPGMENEIANTIVAIRIISNFRTPHSYSFYNLFLTSNSSYLK